ncbi:MAG: hypothetical protein ABIK92_14150 [Pseudomonadota bacterium]
MFNYDTVSKAGIQKLLKILDAGWGPVWRSRGLPTSYEIINV